MNSRFITNTVLATLGAFTVLAAFAFSDPTYIWIMLGAGAAAIALAGAAAVRGRGTVQRGLDATVGVLGAWTIVASLVFSNTTSNDLGFAAGCGMAALALAGLILHELSSERVVHSIDILNTTVLDSELETSLN